MFRQKCRAVDLLILINNKKWLYIRKASVFKEFTCAIYYAKMNMRKVI